MQQKMPTILMIGPLSPPTGGMETFLRELLKSQIHLNFKILHLNNSKPAIMKSKYNFKTGYAASFQRSFLTICKSYLYSIYYFFKYLFLLLFKRIDIVHIHTASYTSFWEKTVYLLFGILFRKPLILHVHGALFNTFYDESGSHLKRIIKWFLSKCNILIALTEAWREFFQTIVDNDKIRVVANGIDLTPYQNINLTKTEIPSILFLGELSRRKGVYDILNTAKIILEKNYKVHFILAGPGELGQVKEQLQKNNLESIVFVAGPVFGQEKIDLLTKSWCFLLPSYAEGMPVAILEAFAAGLPVIATKVGGIPDLIVENENGFLMDAGDVEKMAELINKIIKNQSLRQKISLNNYSKAKERYDINLCVKELEKIYSELYFLS